VARFSHFAKYKKSQAMWSRELFAKFPKKLPEFEESKDFWRI
jgi:hypothetical protein